MGDADVARPTSTACDGPACRVQTCVRATSRGGDPRPAPGDPVPRSDDEQLLEALCRAVVGALGAEGVTVRRSGSRGPGPVTVGIAGSRPAGPGVVSVPLLVEGHVWGSLDLHRSTPWTVADLAVAGLFADAAAALMLLAAERDAWQGAWEEARHTATHDQLTGLPNRGLLLDRLDHAIANAARHRCSVAVLFVDVDDFKAVNDRFGHAAGDAALVEVARRLARTVRANDTLARLSGDEFVVVCEDLDVGTGQVNGWLHHLAERILQEMRSRPAPWGAGLDLSVSIGAAVTTRECGAQSLMSQADEAMYAAKRSGGGRLVVSRGRPAARGQPRRPL